MSQLITTLGPKDANELGLILPHEHVFAHFGDADPAGFAAVDPVDVIERMAPELAAAQHVGVTALVEATSIGGGRRADILKAISEATGMPLVAATGIFREPWIAEWAQTYGQARLCDWMTRELSDQIETSGVRAGWIKLRAGDDGLTEAQTLVLRAAADAGRATGSAIGSHTVRGRVALDQIDVIEAAGYSAEHFIWVHAQVEPDFRLNLQAAERGAWIEYDNIGGEPADEVYVERIQRMLGAGFGDQVLLSHDRGWYDPAVAGGGNSLPYTYLSEVFLPKLRAAGVDDNTVHQLTVTNPFRAYAR